MKVLEVLPQLIRASLENDENSIEVISITLANMLRSKHSSIAEEIDKILFDRNIGNNAYRSIGLSDIPTDKKNNENLINIKEVRDIEMPIVTENIEKLFRNFIKEQEKKLELIKLGLKPSNSILLFGEPGVGKTYSATWLASELNKPLVVLDLATIMSSYLGETGTNVKKVLDYAKKNNCILFLDEFDAIAKTRTDNRELGEIKRIVNILLKELEEWPIGSIIIAATNHEELLDKAIWRRFDLKIHLDLPNDKSRLSIIKKELRNFEHIKEEALNMLVIALEGENGAEIVRLCTEIKREYVLENNDIEKILLSKVGERASNLDKERKIKLVKFMYHEKFKVQEICDIVNISSSSFYRYIK
ncbi:ATP-binding protein [Clostridiaceae bacterium 14S0207]|nr:ATP-binding protein [Clostridiaceae bacterium 14S0207]